MLTECDLNGLVSVYEKYSRLFGLIDFHEKLLKHVMYKIGDLWAQGKIDISTEHACTNAANSLVKVINETISKSNNKHHTLSNYKIMLCTLEGELLSLACNIIESILLSKGFRVYNISPSVPANSVIRFINNIKPDFILISITLLENIKTTKRLIKEVRSRLKKPTDHGWQR